MHTSPDSYLSEVDRFVLDMRKRATVPTALYVAQTTPASSRRATRLHALRSAIPTDTPW